MSVEVQAEQAARVHDRRGVAGRLRPLRNAGYQSAAALVGKVFSFVLLFISTRVLGTGLFGEYTTVLSFVGFFGVLTDLGMGSLAVRDVAQDQSRAVRYVSNVLAVRMVTTLLGVVLICALAQVAIAPSLRIAVYVYALSLLPLAAANTLNLVFQFREHMSLNAILSVATAGLTTVLSIIALALGHHVLGLVIVFTVVTVINAAALSWIVYTRFLPMLLEIDVRWWPTLLRLAAPFSALTVLNVLYSRGDMLILSWESGCRQSTTCTPVGLYGVAYRVLDVLAALFVGTAITVTLPVLNRVLTESRTGVVRVLRSSTSLALAFSAPVALFCSFYATDALHLVGGRQFLDAALALGILSWAFPGMLMVGLYNGGLITLQGQKIVAISFTLTFLFNVALNVLLIPRYSFYASAALTVASEFLNAAFVYVALRRDLGPLGLSGPIAKIAAVTAVAALALWVLRAYGIIIGVPAGTIVFLLGYKFTHLLSDTERDILKGAPLVGRYAHFL